MGLILRGILGEFEVSLQGGVRQSGAFSPSGPPSPARANALLPAPAKLDLDHVCRTSWTF
jgi:hypothetical protein